MKKRILSLLMCLCLSASLLPGTALAAGTEGTTYELGLRQASMAVSNPNQAGPASSQDAPTEYMMTGQDLEWTERNGQNNFWVGVGVEVRSITGGTTTVLVNGQTTTEGYPKYYTGWCNEDGSIPSNLGNAVTPTDTAPVNPEDSGSARIPAIYWGLCEYENGQPVSRLHTEKRYIVVEPAADAPRLSCTIDCTASSSLTFDSNNYKGDTYDISIRPEFGFLDDNMYRQLATDKNWTAKPESLEYIVDYSSVGIGGNRVQFSYFLKKVTNFTSFSTDAAKQSGYYLPFTMSVPDSKHNNVDPSVAEAVAKGKGVFKVTYNGTTETYNIPASGKLPVILYIAGSADSWTSKEAIFSVDWDGPSGMEFFEMVYPVTFDDITDEKGNVISEGITLETDAMIAEAQKFVLANLEDHPTEGDAITNLYDAQNTYLKVTGDKIELRISQLKEHKNSEGETGYWAGIGYQGTATNQYAWGFCETNENNQPQVPATLDWKTMSRTQETDGKTYNTFYWNLSKDDNGNFHCPAYFAVRTGGNDTNSHVFLITFNGFAYTDHVHQWSETWNSNEQHHWHNCIGTGICNLQDVTLFEGYGPHVYDNDADTNCNTCGYTRTVSGGDPGNNNGGSSSSSGNNTTTPSKPVTNPDGSTTTTTEDKTTGTVTETTKKPDGSQTVVETKKDGTVTTKDTDKDGNKTETVAKPDGSSVTTVEQTDGTTASVSTDTSGKVEAEVALPAAVVDQAQKEEKPVALPIPEVKATASANTAPVVTVKTGSADPVKVEIPTADVTPGTVAVIVNADGSEEVIKTSVPTENGLTVALPDGATVKIVDNSKSFADVPTDSWAADAVNFSASRELFSGTGVDSFSPEEPMTRAMLMTVLARFDGADTSGGDTWYEKGMDWAVANGVSDGSAPDGNISREQLAVMLWRYSGSPAPSGSLDGFTDAGAVSGYAQEAMLWAVENGVVSGFGDGTLAPQGQATRAQVAQMMKNFITK